MLITMPAKQKFWTRPAWQNSPLNIAQLALTVVLCGIAQIVTLIRQPFTALNDDSASYLRVAQAILQHGQIFDSERTPGYPLFLAILFFTRQGQNLIAVTVGQTIIMVATIAEIGLLAWRVTRKSWPTTIIVCLAGSNLYFLNWERMVLTEGLSVWVAVTALLVFERCLGVPRPLYFVVLGILCSIAILVRPFFIYLPVVFACVFVVRLVRERQWRVLTPVVAGLVVAYSIVIGYIAGNGLTENYVGLSYITNVNLFGKVLEYHMENSYSDPRFQPLASDALTFTQSGIDDPWQFIKEHPAYGTNNYAELGAYGTDVILHHPIAFVINAIPDIWHTVFAAPKTYARFSTTSSVVKGWLTLNALELLLYVFSPLIFLWAAMEWWRDKRNVPALFVLSAEIIIACDVLVSALASYHITQLGGIPWDEFYRMRFPADFVMLLVTVIVAYDLAAMLIHRLRGPDPGQSIQSMSPTERGSAQPPVSTVVEDPRPQAIHTTPILTLQQAVNGT